MVSLLAVSLGLTATCLLVIRLSVGKEIQRGLDSDISHSLNTFRNETDHRNQLLSREAALLADLPSLKAVMVTQDKQTIHDASETFWTTSGSDFLALSASDGKVFTYRNRGEKLQERTVDASSEQCMKLRQETCLVAFGKRLYQLSIQPIFFGPADNGSQLGWVIIGYSVDQEVARQISDVATAEVVFLIDGTISATTLPAERTRDFAALSARLNTVTAEADTLELGGERYTAAGITLASAGPGTVQMVVLKSFDRASMYLRRVNRRIITVGIFALLLGLLLASGISRTVTRPVEDLVAGTRALGKGHFDYRFLTEGAVEVRELSLAFERMRSALQRSQDELLESDRLATIGRMAGSISHDLRHHLSVIYANAEFMSSARTGEDERLELLLEVNQAVQDMTDLIESLVLFGQTGQVLQRHTESLAHIIDRTVRSVQNHPECRQVDIVALASSPVEASVDGAKLGRAIYNLLLNACQASRQGSVRPTVSISISETEQFFRISVSDTGPGVPPSILNTLFQPFVSVGKVNGTGLGLTVAQHIAQEHGGEVRLDETSPGATTFSIYLDKNALDFAAPLPAAAVLDESSERETPASKQPIESTQENL